MGLGQFHEAKQCYESLREFGESSADKYLKKLAEIRISQNQQPKRAHTAYNSMKDAVRMK